jgi:hypothetical protein
MTPVASPVWIWLFAYRPEWLPGQRQSRRSDRIYPLGVGSSYLNNPRASVVTSTAEYTTDSKESEASPSGTPLGHRLPSPVSERDGESIDKYFSGRPLLSGEATRLLDRSEFAHSSNGGVRAVALKRTQQTHGNVFAQRVVRSIQRKPISAGSVQRKTDAITHPLGAQPRQHIPKVESSVRTGYFAAGGYATGGNLPDPSAALAKHLENTTLTQANDPTEFEADRVAEAAVHSPSTVSNGVAPISERPQDAAVPASDLSVGSSGSPLSESIRQKVEPILNADLSQVRVHDDAAAHESAATLQARAFTHGNHIWLGANQSPSDTSLLAHEATHAVQQSAGKATGGPEVIQRQGWAHVQHPGMPAYPRPPDPYPAGLQCDQRALAAMHTEVVELKGVSEFRPSYWLAEGLSCAAPEPVFVRVRFGTLAAGAIRVRMLPPGPTISAPGTKIRGMYETADAEAFIPLNHPAFPSSGGIGSPKLFITIRNSEVTGAVGFLAGVARIAYLLLPSWQRAFTLERLLGWRGLVDVEPKGYVNELKGGVLQFALQDFTFGLQDLQGFAGFVSEEPDYTGTGNFSVVNEASSFSAETLIKAPGMTDARMPLHRAQGRIFGSASISLNLAPRDLFGGTFSGSLQGTYANGVMKIVGTARYRSPKLNGSVTILIAPRALAWAEVIRQLPSGAPPITAGAATAGGHVVVGWGALDFHINEWLTGHASVVVDPDGYITSHGILRPTKEYLFLTEPGKYEVNKTVAKLSATKTFWTALIASLNGTIDAELKVGGRVGPARLYGLEIEGQFSTRPGSVFTGRITGRANLSAQGSVAASLTGTLDGSVGTPPASVEVVSVSVNITGQATLRAYVELQPTFERIAGPAQDEAQYRITGLLTAAGALSLGVKGSVKFSIVRLGPRINLGKVQYNLGSIGLQAKLSHVLGSGDPIDIEVSAADFKEGQFTGFIQDLFEEDAPENKDPHDKELAQAGGQPPARVPHPTALQTTFYMSGTRHNLWLEHTPGPVLRMASDGDDALDNKLRNEIATVEEQRKNQQAEEAELLTTEASSARSLLAQSTAVERSLGELESEAQPNPDTAGFNELASGLTAYAEQYGKTDLAQASPAAQASDSEDIGPDGKGRYKIETRAQLEAVRKLGPQRPPDLAPELETLWRQYVTYFNERIRLIDRDLTPPKRTVRHEPPLAWPNYIDSVEFYEQLGQKKEFQTELRKTILEQRGDVAAEQAEIDVGLKKGRQKTGYADLVITDPTNNLEVYSLKVRNVTAQTVKLGDDNQVRRWIRENLSQDVKDAIDQYGGKVQFRRPYRSTAEGRAGTSKSGPHPLYEQKVFVNRVILIWKGTGDLVPERFREYILSTGNELGAKYRATISCEVQLQP